MSSAQTATKADRPRRPGPSADPAAYDDQAAAVVRRTDTVGAEQLGGAWEPSRCRWRGPDGAGLRR